MIELENHYFAITFLFFQVRASVNAKITRWKFDEKHDIDIVAKHLPHILINLISKGKIVTL